MKFSPNRWVFRFGCAAWAVLIAKTAIDVRQPSDVLHAVETFSQAVLFAVLVKLGTSKETRIEVK